MDLIVNAIIEKYKNNNTITENNIIKLIDESKPSLLNIELEQHMNKDKKKKNTSTKYVKKFIEKNKDKLKQKIICDVCLSTYTYFNKYTHLKTKRHLTFLNK